MINSKVIIFSTINFVALAVSVTLFLDSDENEINHNNSHNSSEPLNTFSPIAPAPLVIQVKNNNDQIMQQQVLEKKRQQQLQEIELQLQKANETNTELALQLSFLSDELQQNSDHIVAVESKNVALNREIKELNKVTTASTLAPSDSDKMRERIQIQSEFNTQNTRLKSEEIDPLATTEEPSAIEDTTEEDVNKLTGSIAFGFSYEQDNVVSRGIDGRLILDYDESETYNVNSDLKFEFESEDSVKTTDKYRWQLQAGYNLDPRNIVFARTDLQRSEFASYQQEDIYTLGYGRIIFDQAKHKFNVEVGPGYRMAVPNAGKDAVSVDEFILRTRLTYSRKVTDSLQINMDTVLEAGESNSVYGLTLEAQNKIYRELYLIFEFDFKFTESVPVDTVNEEVSTGLRLMYAF